MKKETTDDLRWRRLLSREEYEICRLKGTEAAFSGKYWDCKKPGTYTCRCCGEPLFSSSTKYDSGTGWPSFYQPVGKAAINTREEHSFAMSRTEVVCSQCDCHLGHVFPDGPRPSGLRYCINSASLKLKQS